MVLDIVQIPIIIGLVGVGIAILQRAYKSFLDKKAVEPELKFNGAYLLNALISTGAGVSIVTAVIPAVINELTGQSSIPITIGSIFLNFVSGYALTYTILDTLNNSTSKTIAIEESEKLEE